MFRFRKPKAPRPDPTKQQIVKWNQLQDDIRFIDAFEGLDNDIRLALANDLLDAWLGDLRRYLARDA